MRLARVLVVFGFVTALAFSSVASLGARADPAGGWIAILSGGNEVPARDTNARGVAIFRMIDDETVGYMLIVANIRNVVAAHIHCGAPGVNAAVGVTLYHGSAIPGRFNGILEAHEFTGPDAGTTCAWTSLAMVLEAMSTGNAYVNVHTNDGVAPPNTGAGDFPGGEIRGPVMVAG